MSRSSEFKDLDILLEKWRKILSERYPDFKDHPIIEDGIKNLKNIVLCFYQDQLNDLQFEKAILLETTYHQRLSELIVSDRLIRDEIKLSSKDYGPDFKATKNGQTIWFEVITPNPNDEMKEFLEDQISRLYPKITKHERQNKLALLKMTGAIREKANRFKEYIENNKYEVKDTDCLIIIVNDSLFYPLDVKMIGLTEEIYKGSSCVPLAVEALFGLAPPEWVNDGKTESDYFLKWTQRTEIFKDKAGASVKTDGFLTEQYKHISGVFVMTAREDYGLSRAIYGDNRNAGILVVNNQCENKIGDELLKCEIFNIDSLNELINPCKVKKKFLKKETIEGQYQKLIKEFNK